MRYLLEIAAKAESFPGVQGRLRKTFTCDADAALGRVKEWVVQQGGQILVEANDYPVLLVELPSAPSGLISDLRAATPAP